MGRIKKYSRHSKNKNPKKSRKHNRKPSLVSDEEEIDEHKE